MTTPAPVDPKWLRGPADTLAVSEGCYVDEHAGRVVCAFIEKFCKQSKGRWSGQPIALLDWQRDFLMRFFSWKRPDGRRRYRRFYVEVAKKNGKSTLVAALAIALMFVDGEGAPEEYLNACDRGQARIIFDECARMVRSSPELARRLEVIDSRSRIVWKDGNGAIIANSAEAPNKDGLNPSLTIFDELHRQPNRDLWDVFEYASAAREQPVLGSITTAGEEESGVWFEQREYSERVNSGEIPDTTHLGVVYRAMPTDDIDDPATWAKANPSLGVTIDPADFARELAEAKEVPVKLNNFKRLKLNVVARSSAKYFDAARWLALSPRPLGVGQLRGLPCYMGLDLSSVEDLTALAVLAGDASGYKLITRFWCPEDNLLALEKSTRMPYQMWAEQGYLKPTSGATVDYDYIEAEVVELAEQLGLSKGLIDRWNAQRLATNLIEKHGLPFAFLQQGFVSLSGPTKEFKRLIDARLIEHDGNPVMTWCLGNAVASEDEAGNVKLSKKKSRQKIDGCAAAVNAVAATFPADGDGVESVYATEQLFVI